MVRWVRHGKRPPAAARFQMEQDNPTQIARNEFDLALGGIRLSQIAVPTAKNVGENTGAGACARWGYHQPFDVQTLDSLYRSHGDYLEDVVRATRHNLKRGYILKPDALRTISEAMAADVGRGSKQRFDFDRDHDFGRDD
jgi:hypothetical protein